MAETSSRVLVKLRAPNGRALRWFRRERWSVKFQWEPYECQRATRNPAKGGDLR
jgi:hypothetical protein